MMLLNLNFHPRARIGRPRSPEVNKKHSKTHGHGTLGTVFPHLPGRFRLPVVAPRARVPWKPVPLTELAAKIARPLGPGDEAKAPIEERIGAEHRWHRRSILSSDLMVLPIREIPNRYQRSSET